MISPTATSGYRERQQGFALVVVLWIIAMASLQVSLFNLTVRDATALAANEAAIARGEALVNAGVELAMARIRARNEADRWRADGQERTIGFAGAFLHIRITAESARIDINASDPLVIRGLIAQLTGNEGLAITLADRIADWRDPDDDRRPNGAERGEYGRGSIGASIGNRPFVDMAELSRVLGMPADLARAMQPFITVWNVGGRINPQIAPIEVLRALPGVSGNDLAYLVQLRGQPTLPASSLQQAVATLTRYLGTSFGPAYRIAVRVSSGVVPAIGRAEVVAVREIDEGAPFRVMSWQQEPRTAGGPSGERTR